MLIKQDILVTRDTKNKIRKIVFTLTEDNNIYYIKRSSGLVEGKLTEQPELVIDKGKVKRTVKEQAELQYNSLIKKQLDKGYINSNTINGFVEKQDVLAKIMPLIVTNQNGIGKPMLCSVFDTTDEKNNKSWYISNKLDGTRALFYYKDGVVKTSSRGGQDYDLATEHIRTHPFIITLFEENPNLILDGEIYHHGWPLNKISGLCRLEERHKDHGELCLYCYDVADETKTFKERNEFLKSITTREGYENSPIIVVKHTLIDKQTNIAELTKQLMKLHDDFINQGYEGAVVRDGDAKYKFGGRTKIMQKIKMFSDAEFIIKDIVEGLREEDMCFLMETKEGYQFKAKPVGDRELKQWYRQNINSIKGKMGTVKYFGFTNTDKPVPNLPVFKCIREECY